MFLAQNPFTFSQFLVQCAPVRKFDCVEMWSAQGFSIFVFNRGRRMVVIRLARGGQKKRPFYHIVVTDSRNKRDGRYIERLGFFNPSAQGEEVRLNLNNDRIEHWVKLGAKPSDRVNTLMKETAAA